MTAESLAADERTPLLSQDGDVAQPNNVENGAGADADDAPDKPKLSLVAVVGSFHAPSEHVVHHSRTL